MSILTAPFYALFSVDFYKRVLRTPVERGFLYLAFLAALSTLSLFVMIQTQALPVAEELLGWAKQTMPPLAWSPDGIELRTAESTYTMYHPDHGNVIVFDMEKEGVTLADMGSSQIFITRTKVYYNAGAELLSYDLNLPPDAPNRDRIASITIGPEALDQFFERLKGWVLGVGLVIAFFALYISKLCFVFFCSVIGLIMNQTRQMKLPYRSILLVTIFAITGDTIVEVLQMCIPFLWPIPFGLLGSLLLTTFYLYLGIIKTEEKLEDIVE